MTGINKYDLRNKETITSTLEFLRFDIFFINANVRNRVAHLSVRRKSTFLIYLHKRLSHSKLAYVGTSTIMIFATDIVYDEKSTC